MSKRDRKIIIAVGIAFFAILFIAANYIRQNISEDETSTIYQIVIPYAIHTSESYYVIHDSTSAVCAEMADYPYVKSQLPLLGIDTFKDLLNQNDTSRPFVMKSNSALSYKLISGKQEDEIAASEDPEAYYAQLFPEGEYPITISRVGFNLSNTQALVELGSFSINPNTLEGSGTFYLLQKFFFGWGIIESAVICVE